MPDMFGHYGKNNRIIEVELMQVVSDFKECPDCKVDAWLMRSITQEQKANGSIGDDVVGNTFTKVVTNMDARKPPLVGARILSARVYYDICTKCGKEQPVRIEKGHVTLPASPNMPPVFA